MKKIGITQISSKKYGGIVYNQWIEDALSKNFEVEIVNVVAKYFKDFRYLRIPESFIRLLFLNDKKDLWIRDFYSVIAMPFAKNGAKNLALIYHVDFSTYPIFTKPFFFFFEKLFFYRRLKKTDLIVTVSEYWENHFLNKGYPNVKKIHCGLEVDKFNITSQEVDSFKKKYNLVGKPIVYIGNCQRAKGVVESYDALKDLDVFLVTSGREQVRIPALNLNLDYREYLTLLKASSVAVTMSKFKEGWCITAHEAMLCKTPLIGCGFGGMGELLDGGRQMTCKNFFGLKKKVEYVLNNPLEAEKMGEDGYNFAKNFTKERFNDEWLSLINEMKI